MRTGRRTSPRGAWPPTSSTSSTPSTPSAYGPWTSMTRRWLPSGAVARGRPSRPGSAPGPRLYHPGRTPRRGAKHGGAPPPGPSPTRRRRARQWPTSCTRRDGRPTIPDCMRPSRPRHLRVRRAPASTGECARRRIRETSEDLGTHPRAARHRPPVRPDSECAPDCRACVRRRAPPLRGGRATPTSTSASPRRRGSSSTSSAPRAAAGVSFSAFRRWTREDHGPGWSGRGSEAKNARMSSASSSGSSWAGKWPPRGGVVHRWMR